MKSGCETVCHDQSRMNHSNLFQKSFFIYLASKIQNLPNPNVVIQPPPHNSAWENKNWPPSTFTSVVEISRVAKMAVFHTLSQISNADCGISQKWKSLGPRSSLEAKIWTRAASLRYLDTHQIIYFWCMKHLQKGLSFRLSVPVCDTLPLQFCKMQ